MRRIEPPCQFGACQNIQFHNGDFAFMYEDQQIWGQGSWIQDDYGMHIEGTLILPGAPAGANVLIDIIENPNYGLFTITRPDIALTYGYNTMLICTHRTRKMESVRGNIQVSETTLMLSAHQRGTLQLHRTGEDHWGPHNFRGRELNAGIMTVFL